MNTIRLLALALAASVCLAQSVELQVRNVNLRLQHDVLLQIQSLRGKLDRTDASKPVTFDEPGSFSINVQSGSIAISAASLSLLLNSYVFAYPGSPLKNLTVTFDPAHNRLIQKGTMHKGVDLPFEVEGSLSVTPDGNIRVHAEKIKSAHLPFKGLLHLFGEDLSKLVNLNDARGVRIDGDDMLLYPGRMVPAPHFKGRIVNVFVRGNQLVQVFDSGGKSPALNPPLNARAYIYHKGGVLRFGKLLMEDADLELVREPLSNSFEFCLYDYKRQLVAGYSKYTPSLGLIVHMPDYSAVKKL